MTDKFEKRFGGTAPVTAQTSSIKFYFKEIFAYAKTNPGFDLEFVDSLYDQFQSRGRLSERQTAALENIYDKWVSADHFNDYDDFAYEEY